MSFSKTKNTRRFSMWWYFAILFVSFRRGFFHRSFLVLILCKCVRTYGISVFDWASVRLLEQLTLCYRPNQPTNRPSDNTPSFYDRTRTLLCFFFLCILYVYRIFFSLSLCYCCVNLERYSRINFVSRLFFVVALSMELTRKRVYVHTFVSSFESNWI